MPASSPVRLRRWAIAVLALAMGACGGGSADSPTGLQPLPGSRAELTVAPLDLPEQGYIEPLGHLAPTPHTIPTDHIYFIVVDSDRQPILRDTLKRNVYAPASGVVTLIIVPELVDNRVFVLVTNDFSYYVDHVLARSDLHAGSVVHAGDIIGTTNPGGGIDLGAYDLSTPRLAGLVNPARYPEPELHTVSPIKYFTEPVRSQLYARVRRAATAPDRDGRMDLDVRGRLIGNWYEQSVTNAESQGSTGWIKQIAFVYDNIDPSIPRISIGGTVSSPFLGTIPANAPRFETVSTSSGIVTYSIRYTRDTGFQFGLMLVQMLADDRIKVEVFESQTLTSAQFDGKARIYLR